MSNEECPTALNWAALAEEHAAEVGYRCGCGRPLTRHWDIFIQPDPDGFPVQGYAEKMDVFFICRCWKVHSARKILAIDRYAPRRRNLWIRVKGLLCCVVDAFWG